MQSTESALTVGVATPRGLRGGDCAREPIKQCRVHEALNKIHADPVAAAATTAVAHGCTVLYKEGAAVVACLSIRLIHDLVGVPYLQQPLGDRISAFTKH